MTGEEPHGRTVGDRETRARRRWWIVAALPIVPLAAVLALAAAPSSGVGPAVLLVLFGAGLAALLVVGALRGSAVAAAALPLLAAMPWWLAQLGASRWRTVVWAASVSTLLEAATALALAVGAVLAAPPSLRRSGAAVLAATSALPMLAAAGSLDVSDGVGPLAIALVVVASLGSLSASRDEERARATVAWAASALAALLALGAWLAQRDARLLRELDALPAGEQALLLFEQGRAARAARLVWLLGMLPVAWTIGLQASRAGTRWRHPALALGAAALVGFAAVRLEARALDRFGTARAAALDADDYREVFGFAPFRPIEPEAPCYVGARPRAALVVRDADVHLVTRGSGVERTERFDWRVLDRALWRARALPGGGAPARWAEPGLVAWTDRRLSGGRLGELAAGARHAGYRSLVLLGAGRVVCPLALDTRPPPRRDEIRFLAYRESDGVVLADTAGVRIEIPDRGAARDGAPDVAGLAAKLRERRALEPGRTDVLVALPEARDRLPWLVYLTLVTTATRAGFSEARIDRPELERWRLPELPVENPIPDQSPSSPVSSEQAIVPRVRVGAPTLAGSLSPELVRRVVRRHVNELRFCYERGLVRRRTLRGAVTLRFAVGTDGAVVASATASSSLDDAQVRGCLEAAARRWTFPARPAGDGLAVATVPLTFTSE